MVGGYLQVLVDQIEGRSANGMPVLRHVSHMGVDAVEIAVQLLLTVGASRAAAGHGWGVNAGQRCPCWSACSLGLCSAKMAGQPCKSSTCRQMLDSFAQTLPLLPAAHSGRIPPSLHGQQEGEPLGTFRHVIQEAAAYLPAVVQSIMDLK